jgi:rhodanese-related sulfurtransferase
VVDQTLRTSDPDIFAIGDAIEVRQYVSGVPTCIPMAGPANRQGRIAAVNALGGHLAYKGTQGTAICKVFDMAVGVTGLNEKALVGTSIPYEKIYIHPFSHATYYPGATQMDMKLIFRTDNGRILGAQCVGYDGIDKRIDVLSVAIRAGLSVYDLEDMELAYAPPYGSAKDPVNYAGFVAANILTGQVKICHATDIVAGSHKGFLLDVRTAGEFARGTIPGAVNIPLQQLRDRLSELPKDRQITVFCQVGMRGYLACRILSQKGFDCYNLCGGYRTYLHVSSVP